MSIQKTSSSSPSTGQRRKRKFSERKMKRLIEAVKRDPEFFDYHRAIQIQFARFARALEKEKKAARSRKLGSATAIRLGKQKRQSC